MGFPGRSAGKESTCNSGDPSSIPGMGISLGEGTGFLGYPVSHSGILGLPWWLLKNPLAMQRPRFDPWVDKIPWRREQLPMPVFLPGEFHGLYSPWGLQRVRQEWANFICCWWWFFFSLQYANHPKGVICIFTGSSGVSWMFVEYTEDLICFLSKKKKIEKLEECSIT